MKPRTLVWFRNDLRVHDNPALARAMAAGEAVGVFCVASRQWRSHDVGDNRLAFVLRSLTALADELARLRVPLKVLDTPRFDDVPGALVHLGETVHATGITFNAEYPLNERHRDQQLVRAARDAGLAVHVEHGGLVLPPGSVLTGAGKPYTVFTPFKRRWLELADPGVRTPLPVPRAQRAIEIVGDALPDRFDGTSGERLAELWPGGEAEALTRLARFVDKGLDDYARRRDFPAENGTSALSPYLAVGALSPRRALEVSAPSSAWRDELIWREFYRHVIASFDHVSRGRAFRPAMDAVPWRDDPEAFAAWQAGLTGYPLVDAGMRQLQATGWMHNRVRMVVAMFLSKHLLIDWRWGERHFMQHLVDGDFAANNGGWQWSASTGTDAAPYFRIFNPASQAKKFDPDGAYVRRWVAELSEDGADSDYPSPIVDHREARARALEVFGSAGSESAARAKRSGT